MDSSFSSVSPQGIFEEIVTSIQQGNRDDASNLYAKLVEAAVQTKGPLAIYICLEAMAQMNSASLLDTHGIGKIYKLFSQEEIAQARLLGTRGKLRIPTEEF